MTSSPFRAGVQGGPTRPEPFANFGRYFTEPFGVYFTGKRWQDWLVPSLVSFAVLLGASILCYLPALIVIGPVICGLHACGLCTLRGEHFDVHTLWRGWDVTWTAMGAFIAIQLVIMLPTLLAYAVPVGGFLYLMSLTAGFQAPVGGGPPDADVAFVILGFVALMVVGAVCIIGAIAWSFWIGTRTMFVMPLIADREVDFSTAWRMSWEETRHGFWELLVINFLAGIIGTLGMYALYVGIIVSFPLYVMIIDAAYEDRFAPTAEVFDEAPLPFEQ